VEHLCCELYAIFSGHGDVAKHQFRSETFGHLQSFGRGVTGLGLKAVRQENQPECIGYKVIIINDKHSVSHRGGHASFRAQRNDRELQKHNRADESAIPEK
jgi:hypothetical protein